MERPVAHGEFEAVATAVRRAVASGENPARISFGGTELVLEQGVEGGHTLTSPDSPTGLVMFVDPLQRPEAYPSHLPFVAHELVTVGGPGEGGQAMWWAPTDPARLVRMLREQTIEAGWEVRSESAGPGRPSLYIKDGMMRQVVESAGAVLLVDRKKPSEQDSGTHCRIPDREAGS